MEPLTHALSGAIASRYFTPETKGVRLTLFCVMAAMLPDIDNFINGGGPAAYLLYHRYITHSIFGGAALAALFALPARYLVPSFSYKKVFVVSYCLILTHIFLDLITSFGTMILAPFSQHRFSIPSIFIVDLLYTSVLLTLTIFAFVSRKKSVFVLGAIWLFFYPYACFMLKNGLDERVNRHLAATAGEAAHARVLPDAFTPFRWKVIVTSGDHYEVGGMHPWEDFPERLYRFQKADTAFFRALESRDPIIPVLEWFMAYPALIPETTGGRPAVTLSDLRFFSTWEYLRKKRKGNRLPFSVTIFPGDRGELKDLFYVGPGSVNPPPRRD